MSESPLTVVHVTAGLIPIQHEYGGGVERHIRAVTGELAARGNETLVLDRRHDDDDRADLGSVRVERVSAPRISTGLFDGRVDHIANEVIYAACLGRIREALTDADVVHAHNAYAGLRAKRLAADVGAAFVYTCHNGMWCVPDVNAYERHVVRRVEGHLERTADAGIAVSDAVAAGFRTWAGVDPRVVPNGVDVSTFTPERRGGPRDRYDIGTGPLILFVGRLAPAKGVDVLVRAAPEVLRDHPDATFVLVGPNKHMFGGGEGAEYAAQVDDLLDTHDVRDAFVLTGQVSDEELRDLYAEADVFALPSRFEAQPMVVPEALASGTPVVATDVGGIPEVLTDDVGRLVPSEEPDALSDALLTVLDPDVIEGLSTAARQYAVDRYAWERVVDDIESIYHEVA